MIKNKADITIWLNRQNLGKFTILDDMSVDMHESVYLHFKDITKIPLQFNKVEGDFSCGSNLHLTSLKGVPRIVTRDFRCSQCSITSLEHGPIEVGENYVFSNNPVTSLKGSPAKVGQFEGLGLQLKNLSEMPLQFKKAILSSKYPLEEFDSYCVKGVLTMTQEEYKKIILKNNLNNSLLENNHNPVKIKL